LTGIHSEFRDENKARMMAQYSSVLMGVANETKRHMPNPNT